MMTRQRFETIVRRLEARQKKYPGLYRLQVLLLTLFGYWALFMGVGGAIVVTLLLFVGILFTPSRVVFFTAGAKVFIPVLIVLGGMMKTLFVRLPQPEGLRLTVENSPRLFAVLEDLRQRLRTPKLHQVQLIEGLTASAFESPRWLMFGARRYLRLGLPLLRALSPEELRVVLAHELGHFSRKHARFGARIGRVYDSWAYVQKKLEEKGGASFVSWFLDRYLPYFDAHTFVLRRAAEYEADAISCQTVDPSTAGRALIRLELRNLQLQERFWKFLDHQLRVQAEPPGNLHQVMEGVLKQPLGVDARAWLDQILKEKPSLESTHPTLKERLDSMGCTAEVPPDIEENAAEHYLDPNKVLELQHYLSEQWKYANLEDWRQRHQQCAAATRRLAELESIPRRLELGELWEYALLVDDQRSEDEAIQCFRELLSRDPNHVGALMRLGDHLLARDDAEGEQLLKRAMRLDPAAASAGSRLLIRWHASHGRSREVDEFVATASAADSHSRAMEYERSTWLLTDTLVPPDLPQEVLDHLARAIQKHGTVYVAALVRKQTRYRTEQPLFILAAISSSYTFVRDIRPVLGQLGFQCMVVLCGEQDQRIRKALQVPGARVA